MINAVCACCVLSLNVHSIHTCLNVHMCECIYPLYLFISQCPPLPVA